MLAWVEERERDKSNLASGSPQETLKPEQQNSAAPPAEPQAGGAQLAPQVSDHHSNSPSAPWVKLLPFLGSPRETPEESLTCTALLATRAWVCLQTAGKFTFQRTFCPMCAWRRATKYLIEAARNWTNRAVRWMSWNALSRNIFLWAVQLMTRGSVRKKA